MSGVSQEELRKLRWACRRGMLELDIVFERYLNESYLVASPEEQKAFRLLLVEEDQSLFDWLVKHKPCPKEGLLNIVQKLSLKSF